MAETKTLQREYIIPLRKEFLKVPRYRRGGRAIKAIKKFLVKHMKIRSGDENNIKIDKYLNNEILFKGRKNPPTRVKVKATKEGDIVKVDFVETPQYVKFLQLKHSKRHKKSEVKPEAKLEVKQEASKEQKTEEQKKDEVEKEKATEIMHTKQAEQDAKAQKHLTSIKEPKINRMALKK